MPSPPWIDNMYVLPVLFGLMLNTSSSESPATLTVLPLTAPASVTIAPAGSLLPKSPSMVSEPEAETVLPGSSVTLSPARKVTLPPVDCTIALVATVRSSPVPGASPASSVTASAAVTL
jgi:hypothetical protein